MGSEQQRSHHFLLVTIGIQGQINPARHLARNLVRRTGSRVTIATPLSSHRRMFPGEDTAIVDQGLISFAAYSDGFDNGFHVDSGENELYISKLKLVGTETLTSLTRTLADHGRAVTCIVYTILLSWAADVAIDLGIPSILYWIQPASLFAVYHHYFHGLSEFVSAHKDEPSFELSLPGLPRLRIKDLPSILLTGPNPFADAHDDIFRVLDREKERGGKPRVLVNTFRALEADVVEVMHELDLIPIGPMIDKSTENVSRDLFEQDRSEYIQWLDTKEDRSVVYVSFGSISRLSKRQMEEISVGLKKSGRPFLWVVRTDNKEGVEIDGGDEGMVVEWCDQVKVLSHRSVGCFVTHSGWNSTFESIICGVPTVMLPQWLDQLTNARLVEEAWGVGVRGEVNEDGVVEGREIEKCVQVVMGEGERGKEMRKKADMWREKARKAAEEGGESVQSLVEFVQEI